MRVLDGVDAGTLAELTARGEFFWLDLVDPDAADLDAVAEQLGWHPLALEDVREPGQRPKLDRYGDHILLVFYGARHPAVDDGPAMVEAHLLISAGWVVTVRHGSTPTLDALRVRMSAETAPDEQFVVYRILDTLTDTFFPLLEAIDDEVDALEDQIVIAPDDEQLQRVFRLKRSLVTLRRIVAPQRDLAARAIDELHELPGLHPATHDWFRDIYDHLLRVSDMVDSYRDLLTGVMDVYLSTVSNRLNVVMKQLTLVATVFLPITALTGFFGQNFAWLVRHVDSFAAFAVLGLGGALGSCLALYAWFRRKRFL